MISLVQALDARIDNLDTHGWALETTTNGIRCWRYTAQGRETLTVHLTSDTPNLKIEVNDTIRSYTTTDSIFDALNQAEIWMENHPPSTDPARSH